MLFWKGEIRKKIKNIAENSLTKQAVSPNKTSPRWAIVQLAGRRILVPLIMVRVHVAQPYVPIV